MIAKTIDESEEDIVAEMAGLGETRGTISPILR